MLRPLRFANAVLVAIVFGLMLSGMSLPPILASHVSTTSISNSYSRGGVTEAFTFAVTCSSGPNPITQVNVTIPDGLQARYIVDSGTISDPSGWNHTLHLSFGRIIKVEWNMDTPGNEIQPGGTRYFIFEAQTPNPGSDTSYTWVIDTRDNAAGTDSFSIVTWVDVTSPTIIFVSPLEGEDIEGMTTITVDVSDRSGIQSVMWRWWRGIGYDSPAGPQDISPWEDATRISQNIWHIEFNGSEFVAGFYTIQVQAEDGVGHISTQTSTYRNVVELPPWFVMIAFEVAVMLAIIGAVFYYGAKKRRREKRVRELNDLLKTK